MALELKTVGSSGQISLGKRHAGRTVMVEELEDGVWMVKTARVIPENEMWLHSKKVSAKLDRALARAERHAPRASDLDALERKLKRHLKRRAKH